MLAIGSLAVGLAFDTVPVREASTVGVIVATSVALVGLGGPQASGSVGSPRRARSTHRASRRHDRHRPIGRRRRWYERGRPRPGVPARARSGRRRSSGSSVSSPRESPRAAPAPLAIARTVVGAAFLGVDHRRDAPRPLVPRAARAAARLRSTSSSDGSRWIWPVELVVLIWPIGMLSVLSGSVDDGWNGTLGWFWVACAVTTIGLVFVDPGGAAGAAVLGRDGRDGPALPGDPHRLRHGSRRPRRARRLTVDGGSHGSARRL